MLAVVLILLLPFLIRAAGGAAASPAGRIRSGVAVAALATSWSTRPSTSGSAVPDTETARHLAAGSSASGGRADDDVEDVAASACSTPSSTSGTPDPGADRHRDERPLVGDLDACSALAPRSVPTCARGCVPRCLPRSLRPEAFGPGRGRSAAAA